MEKLAHCLGTTVQHLLREPPFNTFVVPADYLVRDLKQVTIARKPLGKAAAVAISTRPLLAAVNTAHALIDDLYSAELDVAAILGLRNLRICAKLNKMV